MMRDSFDIFYLSHDKPRFPDPRLAKPSGPLAFGGNLLPGTLIEAYSKGIFPWYNKRQGPVIWWSPEERMVLFPEEIHISKSMRSILRNRGWVIRFNTSFEEVVKQCSAAKRKGEEGTWIHEEMINAYVRLHRKGVAHSVEVWKDDRLLGGLYGVYLAGVFSGESMFSLIPNASKAALIALTRLCREGGCPLIDCQIYNPHLERMGARLIEREAFLTFLEKGKKNRALFRPGMKDRPARSLL